MYTALGWSTLARAERSLDSNYERLLAIGIKLQPEQHDAVLLDYARVVNFKVLAALDGDEFARKHLEDMEMRPPGNILQCTLEPFWAAYQASAPERLLSAYRCLKPWMI